MNLNKWLAKNVMKWKLNSYYDINWWDTTAKSVIRVSEWRPTEKIGQAFMCEERLKEMELEQEYSDALESHLTFEVYSYMPSTFQIAHATPLERCRAIYKAMEDK